MSPSRPTTTYAHRRKLLYVASDGEGAWDALRVLFSVFRAMKLIDIITNTTVQSLFIAFMVALVIVAIRRTVKKRSNSNERRQE